MQILHAKSEIHFKIVDFNLDNYAMSIYMITITLLITNSKFKCFMGA